MARNYASAVVHALLFLGCGAVFFWLGVNLLPDCPPTVRVLAYCIAFVCGVMALLYLTDRNARGRCAHCGVKFSVNGRWDSWGLCVPCVYGSDRR